MPDSTDRPVTSASEPMPKLDPRFADAARYAAGKADVSDVMLGRHFEIDNQRAQHLRDQLTDHGVLNRSRSSGRTVLLGADQIEALLERLGLGLGVDKGAGTATSTTSHPDQEVLSPSTHEHAEPPTGPAQQVAVDQTGDVQRDETTPTGADPQASTSQATEPNRAPMATSEPSLPEQAPADLATQPATPQDRTDRAPSNTASGSTGSDLPWADQTPVRQVLAVEQITVDPTIQCWVQADTQRSETYAALMAEGIVFPPVTLFAQDSKYLLADGFHRLAAIRQLGHVSIEVQIYQGDPSQALLFAATANRAHGLMMTREDKRQAITRLLHDPVWAQRSDRWLAGMVQVDHKTVAAVRVGLVSTGEIPQCSTRSTRDGRQMKVTPKSRPGAKGPRGRKTSKPGNRRMLATTKSTPVDRAPAPAPVDAHDTAARSITEAGPVAVEIQGEAPAPHAPNASPQHDPDAPLAPDTSPHPPQHAVGCPASAAPGDAEPSPGPGPAPSPGRWWEQLAVVVQRAEAEGFAGFGLEEGPRTLLRDQLLEQLEILAELATQLTPEQPSLRAAA